MTATNAVTEDDVQGAQNDDYNLYQARLACTQRLQSSFEDIIRKYERDFSDADEIDLRTGEVVVNNGHIELLEEEQDGEEEDDTEAEQLEDDIELRAHLLEKQRLLAPAKDPLWQAPDLPTDARFDRGTTRAHANVTTKAAAGAPAGIRDRSKKMRPLGIRRQRARRNIWFPSTRIRSNMDPMEIRTLVGFTRRKGVAVEEIYAALPHRQPDILRQWIRKFRVPSESPETWTSEKQAVMNELVASTSHISWKDVFARFKDMRHKELKRMWTKTCLEAADAASTTPPENVEEKQPEHGSFEVRIPTPSKGMSGKSDGEADDPESPGSVEPLTSDDSAIAPEGDSQDASVKAPADPTVETLAAAWQPSDDQRENGTPSQDDAVTSTTENEAQSAEPEGRLETGETDDVETGEREPSPQRSLRGALQSQQEEPREANMVVEITARRPSPMATEPADLPLAANDDGHAAGQQINDPEVHADNAKPSKAERNAFEVRLPSPSRPDKDGASTPALKNTSAETNEDTATKKSPAKPVKPAQKPSAATPEQPKPQVPAPASVPKQLRTPGVRTVTRLGASAKSTSKKRVAASRPKSIPKTVPPQTPVQLNGGSDSDDPLSVAAQTCSTKRRKVSSTPRYDRKKTAATTETPMAKKQKIAPEGSAESDSDDPLSTPLPASRPGLDRAKLTTPSQQRVTK
ncbi:hypothetical protein KEM55_002929 [Ascosphaera atra]|nr:hypothetical protein KEM55_002929 [Ascosphaera atra]